MLKILIADDEKIIRETIANLIDWKSLGLNLIGCVKNGMEAYNMILDEYPEIVLTDIRMPLLSGLDLIEKIYALNKNTQFIILSAYSEFEYAQKAMQFGVRHYLVKPCNENQIIHCLKEVIKDYYALCATSPDFQGTSLLNTQFQNSLIINLINSGLASFYTNSADFERELEDKSRYFASPSPSYDVAYLYFLEETNKTLAVQDVTAFRNQYFPRLALYTLYVKNTCIFLFNSAGIDCAPLDAYISHLCYPFQPTEMVYERKTFDSFSSALCEIIRKVRRFDTVYYTNSTNFITINNYKNVLQDVLELTAHIHGTSQEKMAASFSLLCDLLSSITDAEFLKQISSSVIITFVHSHPTFTAVSAAELLLQIDKLEDCGQICNILIPKLQLLVDEYTSSGSTGALSKKVQQYVEENISASDLSLKWIAENYLYMNVDYLSKKFFKETGQKFSRYLTDVRIKKAKELLSDTEVDKIQNVARQVGLENNPQYFSQIFKKSTGMTPSQYIRVMQGHNKEV